jgi:hypothetical protein
MDQPTSTGPPKWTGRRGGWDYRWVPVGTGTRRHENRAHTQRTILRHQRPGDETVRPVPQRGCAVRHMCRHRRRAARRTTEGRRQLDGGPRSGQSVGAVAPQQEQRGAGEHRGCRRPAGQERGRPGRARARAARAAVGQDLRGERRDVGRRRRGAGDRRPVGGGVAGCGPASPSASVGPLVVARDRGPQTATASCVRGSGSTSRVGRTASGRRVTVGVGRDRRRRADVGVGVRRSASPSGSASGRTRGTVTMGGQVPVRREDRAARSLLVGLHQPMSRRVVRRLAPGEHGRVAVRLVLLDGPALPAERQPVRQRPRRTSASVRSRHEAPGHVVTGTAGSSCSPLPACAGPS